jgi:hypothetical protein
MQDVGPVCLRCAGLDHLFSCPPVTPDSPVVPTAPASCPQSWSASAAAATAVKGKDCSSQARVGPCAAEPPRNRLEGRSESTALAMIACAGSFLVGRSGAGGGGPGTGET